MTVLLIARQALTSQMLAGVFLRVFVSYLLVHYRDVSVGRVLLSCLRMHTACPPRARILRGRGASGQPSDQSVAVRCIICCDPRCQGAIDS